MTALFYGVRPDYYAPAALRGALAVATLACLLPARRASRIDPARTLHQE